MVTAGKRAILILSALTGDTGGVASYCRTLLRFCMRKGIKCEWFSPGDLHPLVEARSMMKQRLRSNRQTGVVSWLLKMAVTTFLLRCRGLLDWGPRLIVSMDVIASSAVRSNLLVVHGAYADEILLRVRHRLAYAVALEKERRAYLTAREVVAVDDSISQRIRALTGRSVIVIPNPINLQLFRPINKSDTRRILGLESAAKVVLFVGGSPEKYGEEIPVWRAELHSRGFKTLHATKVPYDQMPIYYNAADVTVAMSRVAAVGRAVIESLACGTPAISNNSPLAVYSTPENLVESIEQLADRGRERLRSKALDYDESKLLDRLLQIAYSTS